MLKKISTSLITVLLLTFITIPAFADDLTEVENSSQTQNSDTLVTQEQNVNSNGTADKIDLDQNSTTEKTQEQNATPEGALQQEQSTTINASQNQAIDHAKVLDADQNQGVNINASQSQTTTSKTQEQSQSIISNQDQSIDANATKTAEQGQDISIENSQQQELNESTEINTNSTNVHASQEQILELEGDATLTQEQSLQSKGTATLTQEQNVKLTAEELAIKTTNEIIIDLLVTVCQTIKIDGEIDISHTDEFSLDENSYHNNLSKVYKYDWGTVSVITKYLVEKRENDTIYSWMESSIDIQHYRPDPPVDSDGDGLTDEEEIRLGLDPYNRDTDGDGLTDYFEVMYYVEGVLDPLKKDTDNNGILDSDEDPDNDGITNIDEQANGTNPHVSDK